jgi:hypothetical protein
MVFKTAMHRLNMRANALQFTVSIRISKCVFRYSAAGAATFTMRRGWMVTAVASYSAVPAGFDSRIGGRLSWNVFRGLS